MWDQVLLGIYEAENEARWRQAFDRADAPTKQLMIQDRAHAQRMKEIERQADLQKDAEFLKRLNELHRL